MTFNRILNIFKYPKIWSVLIAGFIIYELIVLLAPMKGQSKTIEEYAAQIVTECSTASYKPSCYDEAIPQLMDSISLEDAFKVTSIVQDKDKTYTYCHVLGHELSAREVQKDPTKWKDVVTRIPSGICSNGGIHGAFQERFRKEYLTPDELLVIKPELMGICEKRGGWSPTGLEQGSCYHALGHLAMYLTRAEIDQALDLCDDLAVKNIRDYSQLCYDGAFMQIHQPLEPDDFDLIRGKEIAKDELEDFCKKYTGTRKGSCWSEGWPLFRTELQSPAGLTDFCSKTIETQINRCYDALVYVMTAQFGLSAERIVPYCAGLKDPYNANCLASAASRFIETDYRNLDKAVAMCSTGANYDDEGRCYQKLVQYSDYNYHRGSGEALKVCNSLPSPWKDQCFTKNEQE